LGRFGLKGILFHRQAYPSELIGEVLAQGGGLFRPGGARAEANDELEVAPCAGHVEGGMRLHHADEFTLVRLERALHEQRHAKEEDEHAHPNYYDDFHCYVVASVHGLRLTTGFTGAKRASQLR